MSPILLMTPDTGVTFTSTVIIAGISIVVGVLLLLILVFSIFGKMMPGIEKKVTANEKRRAEKKAARKAAKEAKKAAKRAAADDINGAVVSQPSASKPVQTAPAAVKAAPKAPVVEAGISGEVVAAIAAAVAASEGAGAVVRSIRKKNVGGRNPWAQAADIENTRPF